MSKPTIALTKVCASCGQQKPLSAFLQLAGQQGSTYGNICSSCRKTNLDIPKEPEESTTSTTGVKIDSKSKVQGEIDKRELRKQIEEDYFEEREKQEQKQSQKTEKTLSIAKDEKKHRDSFLTSGLDRLKKTYNNKTTSVFGGEEQKAEAAKMDFAAGPVEFTRVTGQVKVTQSLAFKAFKSWLGSAAPVVKATERALSNNNKNAGENTALDALTEEINETFNKPGRK